MSPTSDSPAMPVSLSGTAINPNSKVPIYHQLHELLRQKIIAGEWQPEQLIPSEPELMRHYNVSRITVRQALDMLVQQNLVYRQRGRGTYVTRPNLASDANRILSFREEMRKRGLHTRTQVLEIGKAPISLGTAEKMNLEVGADVAYVKLLQYANGKPVCIEQSYVLDARFPGIFQSFDMASVSVLEALEQGYGIRLVRAEQTIAAMEALDQMVELLENEHNPIVLYLERVSYSQSNEAIEYRRCYYRADSYVMQMELRG